MGFTPDFEQEHDITLNERKTLKNVMSFVLDEWFTCDRAEKGKRLSFYLDTSVRRSTWLT